MSFLLFGLLGAGLLFVGVVQLNKVGTGSSRPELWQLMVNDMTLEAMKRQLSRVSKWTLAAAFCAWGLSSFFLVKYMTGDVLNPVEWDFEQWGNAGFALLLTAIITAFQFFLYSINQKGFAALIGVAVVVFFGLFSEISNSMEREGATVRARSEGSSVFQATVTAIGTTTTGATTAAVSPALVKAEADKATALVEIEACERHRSKGQARVDRCLRIERGNLAAAQASINAIKQSQKEATAANQSHALALVDKASALSFDENQHFEVIKLLKEWLGIAAIFASFLFSFIIMGTFEYAFHYLAIYAANLKKAIKYSEEQAPEKAGNDQSISPEEVPAGSGVSSPKSLDVKAESQAVPFGFAPSEKIKNQPKAEKPTKQRIGQTGRYNPVLGKSEYQYAMSLEKPLHSKPESRVSACTVHDSEKPTDTRVSPCTVHGEAVAENSEKGQGKSFTPDLYETLKTKLLNRDFSPTFRPIKAFLKAEEVGASDRVRQDTAADALRRLFSEGVLLENPKDDGAGMKKAKYIINPEYQA